MDCATNYPMVMTVCMSEQSEHLAPLVACFINAL